MEDGMEGALKRKRPWKIIAVAVIALLAVLTFAQILTRIA